MAIKGYKDNEQQAFTPTPTDWLGIQQGSLLSDMKKITYKDLTDPLQGQIDDHEERIAQNESDIGTLEGVVDTNRLYSDSQYLDLKAKYEAQQIALNASKAELYTDNPILQYGAVEIIGKGYEADDTQIDVSANVVDGSLELEQKGLTITNLLGSRGDFETTGLIYTCIFGAGSGTAGTFAINTISPISGSRDTKLTVTTAGISEAYPLLNYLNSNLPDLIIGHVYLLAFDYKVNSGTAILKQSYNGTGTVAVNKTFTGSGRFGFLLTCEADNGDFGNLYWDGRNTFDIQLDNFSVVDLTALGLDHITDTDILSQLLPYVDGTKAVGKMGMRVVGKNMANGDIVWSSKWSESLALSIPLVPYTAHRLSISSVLNASNWRYLRKFYKNGVDISASLTPSQAGYGSDGAYFEASGCWISGVNVTEKSMVFFPSADVDCDEVRILLTIGTGTSSVTKTVNTMLNLGSTALPYEPYQEQLTFLPAIGNSLPNGVADSVKTTVDGWEHTKRVSELVILEASITEETVYVYTNVTYFKIARPSDYIYPTSALAGKVLGTLGHASFIDYVGSTFDTLDRIGQMSATALTGVIWFGFAKGTTLAQAKAVLANTILRYQLATPIVTKYPLPLPASGKTIHRFAGEEKIALYGTGLTFSENVLTVLSAVKFVAGVMTDITDLATITDDTVTFSGVNATDVVYVKVEHDVDRPLGILEHTPAVSNTASRLASLEARVTALEV